MLFDIRMLTLLFSKKFLILSSNLVNDELDLFALSLS